VAGHGPSSAGLARERRVRGSNPPPPRSSTAATSLVDRRHLARRTRWVSDARGSACCDRGGDTRHCPDPSARPEDRVPAQAVAKCGSSGQRPGLLRPGRPLQVHSATVCMPCSKPRMQLMDAVDDPLPLGAALHTCRSAQRPTLRRGEVRPLISAAQRRRSPAAWYGRTREGTGYYHTVLTRICTSFR